MYQCLETFKSKTGITFIKNEVYNISGEMPHDEMIHFVKIKSTKEDNDDTIMDAIGDVAFDSVAANILSDDDSSSPDEPSSSNDSDFGGFGGGDDGGGGATGEW